MSRDSTHGLRWTFWLAASVAMTLLVYHTERGPTVLALWCQRDWIVGPSDG